MPRHLIVKLGAIGDCLMLLPAVDALRREAERTEIDWVCGDAVAPLLRLYPWIRVIAVEERRFFRGSLRERVGVLAGVWRRLAGKSYDLCAAMYYDRRYRMISWPVRARRRVELVHGRRDRELIAGRHHSDEFARVLLGWTDDVRPEALRPVPPPEMPQSPLERLREGDVGGWRRVVLVPGGAKNLLRDDALRRWPVTRYVELTQKLLERGCEVVLAGGPEDVGVVPAFAGLGVRSVVGTLSLVETLGLFANAELVVTHDTGPLHLAGLTKTPLVGVFGPTDPHGRLPQRAGAAAIWGGERFACRPCYDGHGYAACHRNACVEEVSAEMVLRLSELLWREPGLPPTVFAPSCVPGEMFGRAL